MQSSRMLTIEECETVVRKCLKSDNIQIGEFTIIRLQNENFLVRITVNHDSEEKTLKFFAKSSTKVLKVYQILFKDFKKILPKFESKIAPKLYYWKPDFLLFEDLTWQGFQTQQGFFNLEQIKIVLEVLAKFHSSSFAYEEIKSHELGKKYRLDEEYKLVSSNIGLQETEVKKFVSLLGEESDPKKIIEDLKARQFSHKCRKTLCHSNLIPENIMFKNKDGIPVDCKLINFKSKHYAPSVYDVLQLIFFNTSEDFRKQYLEALIAHYYNCLKTELQNYCLKIEDILTFDELQLASHSVLPLIKLEVALHYDQKNCALEEFKEAIKCPFLSREDCYVIARNKIGTSDFSFLSFTVTPLDQTNGFLGDYHKLKIKILHKNEEQTLNCFIKRIPKGSTSKGMVEETGCFFKEIFIYQTLVSEMHQLGIYTLDECLAPCYLQRSEDLMVFEDMSMQDFKTLSAQIPFDFELLCLVLRKLAKFHASMIVFEERMSEKLGRKYRINEQYEKYVTEIFFSKEATHAGARLMQTGVRSIPDVANLFPELKTDENQNNFKAVWPKLQELFFDVIRVSDRYRNVLSHGDLWTNNIMIQLDGKKPVDSRFVDYQCTRYCPPAHDYLSVLYLTTDRATRTKYEERFPKIYFDELSQILSFYGYNVAEIYPYQDFVESIQYIKPEIVMQAVMYGSFCQLTSEEVASFLTSDEICKKVFFEDRKEYLATMSKKSPAYKNKLRECILDFYDLCNLMCSE